MMDGGSDFGPPQTSGRSDRELLASFGLEMPGGNDRGYPQAMDGVAGYGPQSMDRTSGGHTPAWMDGTGQRRSQTTGGVHVDMCLDMGMYTSAAFRRERSCTQVHARFHTSAKMAR